MNAQNTKTLIKSDFDLSIDEKGLIIAIRTDRTIALMKAFVMTDKNPPAPRKEMSPAEGWIYVERAYPLTAAETKIITALREGRKHEAFDLVVDAVYAKNRVTRNFVPWRMRPAIEQPDPARAWLWAEQNRHVQHGKPPVFFFHR